MPMIDKIENRYVFFIFSAHILLVHFITILSFAQGYGVLCAMVALSLAQNPHWVFADVSA